MTVPGELKPVRTKCPNLLESLQDLRQGLWQLREGKSVLLLKWPVVGDEVEAELIAGEVKIAMHDKEQLAVVEGEIP
jgi:hypothetical protein